MTDITKQLAEAVELLLKRGSKWHPCDAHVMSAKAALSAYHSQQSNPCDMGEICIGCEPRREDGGCPGEKAQAVPVASSCRVGSTCGCANGTERCPRTLDSSAELVTDDEAMDGAFMRGFKAARRQDPDAYDRGVIAGLRQAAAICADREDLTADRLKAEIEAAAPQPPQQEERKPLTDEQIADASEAFAWVNLNQTEHRNSFARAIEAAHGIRSTGGEHA